MSKEMMDVMYEVCVAAEEEKELGSVPLNYEEFVEKEEE